MQSRDGTPSLRQAPAAVAEGDVVATAVVVFWYAAVGSIVDAEPKLEIREEIAVLSGTAEDLVVF